MRVALLACVLVAACGKGESTPKKDDAAVARETPVAVAVIEPLALGLPDLEAYRWRARGGHPAFRVARTAERREDWPAVITTCRQALTADPSHLEAAWLLAAALGRAGRPDEILEPLTRAVAGDFGKWGQASLELPALQAFLATPTGQAWRTRVEQDQHAYVAGLARSVLAVAGGDLFAFDPQRKRWHRLTRTYGAVIGVLRVPAANKLVYVTRSGAKARRQFGAGIVDLSRGRTSRPIALGTDKPLLLAYATKAPTAGIWFGTAKAWRRIEGGKLVALPPKTRRPPGAYLELRGRKARLRGLPPDVIADWDDQGLASAIRIGRSNRVVSIPSPGLIDGNTAAWAADRSRLAFVAQLDDECTPGSIASAAFVADAATGKLHELERAATGLAVEWVADHTLAIAGDRGVAIHDLQAGTSTRLDGAEGLIPARQGPKCVAAEPEPPDVEPEPDDEESANVEPIP